MTLEFTLANWNLKIHLSNQTLFGDFITIHKTSVLNLNLIFPKILFFVCG